MHTHIVQYNTSNLTHTSHLVQHIGTDQAQGPRPLSSKVEVVASLSFPALAPPCLLCFLLGAPLAETVTFDVDGPETWRIALEWFPDNPGALASRVTLA